MDEPALDAVDEVEAQKIEFLADLPELTDGLTRQLVHWLH